MSITGIFFTPSNPNSSTILPTLTERLHTLLSDDPVPIGRWALEHKLMRDTPSCLPASASQRPAQPRYMQFLSLSYYPFHGFVCASEGELNVQQPQQQPGQPQPQPQHSTGQQSMVMTTMPLPSTSTLFHHVVYACQPFWCHRHTHAVPGGMVYDIGDFRVRLGDVRQMQPVARVRGTVVEVEWRGPSVVGSLVASMARRRSARRRSASRGHGDGYDDGGYGGGGEGDGDGSGIDITSTEIEETDIDAEYAATATLIREFWTKLGIEGAREAILVPDVGKEMKERLRRWRQQEVKGQGQKQTRGGNGDEAAGQLDEDPDPQAGVDVARQYMEILRFNR